MGFLFSGRSAPEPSRSVVLPSLFRSRLSQRIVLAVFSAIVAIEAIILVPSIARREQELLQHLQALSTAYLSGLLAATDPPIAQQSAQAILARISLAQSLNETIRGGTLYRADGTWVGSFGEPPQLEFGAGDRRLYRRSRRYDSRWLMSPLDGSYVLIVRHDSSAVRREVWQFVGRIAGLVVIISGVVTLATIVVLRKLLIKPILTLRNDLLSAAPAVLDAAGSDRPVFLSQRLASRRDELGEVIMAFQQMYGQISQAIAQRLQAEQNLRESEARFRTVVNQAAESILVIDAEGRIQSANPFALNYLGYASEELLGRSILEINPVFDRDRFDQHWQTVQRGEPVTLETVHRRRDGKTYPVEVRSGLIWMDGKAQILSLVRDISARKAAEQAQARLAEIGELAAMIVHEVRNPLATVFMALTGFKRMELPKLGQMRLALALEESERLQRLLNEILAYAREQRLEGERLELNQMSQQLWQSLAQLPQVRERQIRLQPWSAPVWVEGDRDKLKQVFINLVTNACEAIAPGEQVIWQLESITSPLSLPQVRVQIHNGGDPIPAEILPKLMQPFVSTKPTGNGLGLAITKRIVEAHGGSLAIASDAETGTMVTVLLPLATEL